ncbi:DMT family transporter [Thalassotalea marina]|uniref:Multidrug transporter n=1 Tax=Thalassotalea marina TaxID=1673741 RepID=A0A919BQV9_9GAMM|nr:DMT family transporter [Thalassotalea marina]GHG06390.1 multidrug transporter [Thalassotalea marina]
MLKRYIPAFFVLLWSTGFIGTKMGLPYASAGDFLSIRALANVVIIFIILLVIKAPKLNRKQILHAGVTGTLIHGAYLGGVFCAIELGIPAGLTAIIVGLQPLLTALLAIAVFNATVTRVQWLALFFGFVGLVLVLGSSLTLTGISAFAITFTLVALVGITIGTMYQKRFCQGQALLPSVFWQYVASLLVFLPIALLEPVKPVQWNLTFVATLTWLVLGLSVVAILLLMYMVEQGEASKVTAYMYLVPPVTAVEAWLLFDEKLSLLSISGMIVCALSVYWLMNTNKSSVKTG